MGIVCVRPRTLCLLLGGSDSRLIFSRKGVFAVLLGSFGLRKSLNAAIPQTLRHAASVIAIISIDTDGQITYINQPGMELVQELTGRERLPRTLIGQNLAKVLNKGLASTVIGRTIQTGREIQGQLLAFGQSLYTVMTKLIRDNDNTIGCVEYAIKVRKSERKEKLQVSQAFARHLASKLGYQSTEWIDDISYEHSQQLIRYLCQSNHMVELTEYCPYKFQCAFNPEHGYLALDRRNYRRIAIELPVEVHLLGLSHGLPVPEGIRQKPAFGTTIDLSLKGAQIRCPVRLPLNSTIEINFKEIEKPITCTGEVVWQRQNDAGDWLTGIKFQSVSNEDSSNIITLLNRQELKARRSSSA